MTIKQLAQKIGKHEAILEALSPTSPSRDREVRALDRARADYDEAVRTWGREHADH